MFSEFSVSRTRSTQPWTNSKFRPIRISVIALICTFVIHTYMEIKLSPRYFLSFNSSMNTSNQSPTICTPTILTLFSLTINKSDFQARSVVSMSTQKPSRNNSPDTSISSLLGNHYINGRMLGIQVLLKL